MSKQGWIGVDFDGTLCKHGANWKIGDPADTGEPVPAMVERVKSWLLQGLEVRIVTARAAPSAFYSVDEQIGMVQDWCEKHVGMRLPVGCSKDLGMVELWDDRAVQVVRDMGETIEDATARRILEWIERRDFDPSDANALGDAVWGIKQGAWR